MKIEVMTANERAGHSNADEFVEKLLPEEFGYACEVGANNGIFCSNTLRFENRGWRCLCIEPNPLLITELAQNRADVVGCAVGNYTGVKEFSCFGEYPYAAFSGFHPQIGIDRAAQHALNPRPKKFIVPMFRLNDLLCFAKFPQLDLLCVDTEGSELEVLQSLGLNRWQPRVIIVEQFLGEPSHDYLTESGYRLMADYQYDFVYQLQ